MDAKCICCTSSNSQLIALKKCKHTTFLKTCIKLKILRKSNICFICHNMLKKIEVFKQQVEDSQELLFSKASTIKLKKIYNLKSIILETNDKTIFNSDPLELENQITELKILKSIESNDVIKNDTQITKKETNEFNDIQITDLKIEHEIFESDNEARNKEANEFNDLKIEHETFELDCEDTNQEINEFNNTEFNNSEIKQKNYESESEMPLIEVKKSKKARYIDQYVGKVNILRLTLEDLKKEREDMTREQKYIKFPYKCEYCIVGFDHEPTFKSHMEKRHTKTEYNYQCEICMSVLKKEANYNDHRKRHFVRYQCVECGKKYNHDHSVMEHFDKYHSPEGTSPLRSFVCRHCGFTTSRGRLYRYHLDKHKNKHECEICGNTFITKNSLKIHLYTVHGQSSRVYSCTLCNKTYRADSGLGAHMRSVHSTARAYCALCRTHYVTAHALSVHLATHSRHIQDTDKRYICDDCGAKFVRKHSLEVHINWEHLKISSHRCSKCSKVFKAKKCLLRHIKYVHEKYRPPRDKICHICGRGFTTQKTLESHIRTHTGERPFQCKHCKATFGHSGALYTHIKLKHNGLKK